MLAQLAQAVRERRLSAVELVRESIDRIERLNPALNAVTAVWPEEALAEAEELDERGAEGPLAGLPLLVKDNTDVAGKVTNFGSRTMLARPPAERSEITVERMIAAGAIVLGRTNIPEFAFQGWTDNDVFGPTHNPWGLEWSPGGSSGGSGAALAAGLVPLATGTDGGGSIRTPAAFCGLDGSQADGGADRTASDPVVARGLDAGTARARRRGREAAAARDARARRRATRRPRPRGSTAAGCPGASWRPRGLGTSGRCRPRWTNRSARRSRRSNVTWVSRSRRSRPRRCSPRAGVTDGESRDDWYATVAAEELQFARPRVGRGAPGRVQRDLPVRDGARRSGSRSTTTSQLGIGASSTPRISTGCSTTTRSSSCRPTGTRDGSPTGCCPAPIAPPGRGLQRRRVQPERPPGAQRSGRP